MAQAVLAAGIPTIEEGSAQKRKRNIVYGINYFEESQEHPIKTKILLIKGKGAQTIVSALFPYFIGKKQFPGSGGNDCLFKGTMVELNSMNQFFTGGECLQNHKNI